MSESPKKARTAPEPAKVLQVQTEPATWLLSLLCRCYGGGSASTCHQESIPRYRTLSHWFPCWIANIYDIGILTSEEHGICHLYVQDAAPFTKIMVLPGDVAPNGSNLNSVLFLQYSFQAVPVHDTVRTESLNRVEMEWMEPPRYN